MRLIKMFGLAAIAAVTAMAFVSATSASAETSTQLCNDHLELTCSNAASSVHMVLAPGTVGGILGGLGGGGSLYNILCLNVLVESSGADVGSLGNPQRLDFTSMSFTGCGTGSAHNNCTLTVEELPDNNLLKLGLDEGSLEALNGRLRLACANLGLDCVFDLEGILSAVGAQHLTTQTLAPELGGKFLCPNMAAPTWLLETLEDRFVLQ